MSLAESRGQFSKGALEESQLDPEPLRQFARWFAEAESAREPEPETMVLATVNAAGKPAARVVFLRGLDNIGFYFYTSYQSAKAREMESNPAVALVFHWHTLERQVRVEGQVERGDETLADSYFRTRPRGSQLGAWASPQSEVLASRAVLEERLRAIEERFGAGPIPRPPFWGGYRVVPERIEFWQGRQSRLHDRLCYRRTESHVWVLERLAP